MYCHLFMVHSVLVGEVSWWISLCQVLKFGNCTFSRFGFIVRTNRHTESQTRMIALLPQLWSTWEIICNKVCGLCNCIMRMRTLTVVCQHVVRANQHGRDSAQLCDARYVPAMWRHRLYVAALSYPRGLRPRHLRFLRRRDVHQGHRNGSPR